MIAVFFFINGKLDEPFVHLAGWQQLVLGVAITTVGWIAITLWTKPSSKETLEKFNALIFGNEGRFHNFKYKLLCFFLGTVGIYSALIGTGYFIYGKTTLALLISAVALTAFYAISRFWKKIV